MFSRIARPALRAFNASAGARRAASSAAVTVRATARPINYLAAAAGLAAATAVYSLNERDSRGNALFGMADEDDVAALAARVQNLEVALAGKTNSAFVFLKPHAVNDKVAALLRAHMAANGIRVTNEGVLSAQTIDELQLIDNHYGAIAAKAVKLKPCELNVPAKGQAAFESAFGLSWDDAIKQGKVYNAADACKKLGITADDLDKKWSTLKRGTNLLKFGGGFYCGQVDGIFVMNGFYMSMRSAYTSAPAKLHYFTVQWPSDALSWEDFRGRVLGATDPSTAESGSLRRQILEQWKPLGLSSCPNVGENGVHASASPFEALAERMNWMGVKVDEDEFGRGMLAAGISKDTIASWSTDPQVTYDGKKGSLFDLLEDLDAADVLAKVQDIQ